MLLKGVNLVDRKKIKESAKAKIKGNIWNILWPLIVIGVIQSALSNLFGATINIDLSNLDSVKVPTDAYMNFYGVSIIMAILYAGYLKYILHFVRTGKFNTNSILDTVKKKWLNILIASILSSFIISICFLLFVIPGIVMSLAFTLVIYLVVETDIAGNDSLKKSREIMNGYKWDYFVFVLSFIGWFLLIPFTLGIILIWLVPYFRVANAIYYDELYKKIKK
jgi:uncharacterized membrane protein